MVKINHPVSQYLSFLLILFIGFSCSNSNEKKSDNTWNAVDKSIASTSEKKQQYQSKIDIVEPKVGKVITRGDGLSLSLDTLKDDRTIDSLAIFVNDQKIQVQNLLIKTDGFKAGNNVISIKSYNSDGSKDNVSTHITMVSDLPPERKKVKVIKKYTHDVRAYTQGLIFKNGFMYEGTGQYGESMLKKIDLNKNDLIQSYNLPKEVFGEGIVEHGNKIYQLTWQSKRAFVYDLKTFELIHEFVYDTEGWGITNYGDNLIMSDGTQNLYILDPESFSTIEQLQVYDNIGPIHNLNELEWINGKIWANVYLTNTIVIINPETGFVEQKLDLSALVPDTYADPHDNVLNGIAYDESANKIYVTGKRWPVLYEIKIDE